MPAGWVGTPAGLQAAASMVCWSTKRTIEEKYEHPQQTNIETLQRQNSKIFLLVSYKDWYPTLQFFGSLHWWHPKAGSFLLFLPLRGAWLPGCRGPIGPGASRGPKLSEFHVGFVDQMGWLVTTDQHLRKNQLICWFVFFELICKHFKLTALFFLKKTPEASGLKRFLFISHLFFVGTVRWGPRWGRCDAAGFGAAFWTGHLCGEVSSTSGISRLVMYFLGG